MTSTEATTAPAVLTPRARIKAIFAGSMGNLIEWYDFYVYAFTALYFASAFFPDGDRTAQLLNTAGIYAAGFLARPVGGWYFGRYADRHGRRASMVASVLLMGAGSLMIAVLPTHAEIGLFAPALLLIARLLQGFSTGGQYGTAATYLSEVASNERRGFFASFQFVTLIGGQLAALLVLLALGQVLNDGEIRAWGWRVPFALGAVMALGFIFFRDAMHETAPTEKSSEAGSLRSLAKHPKALLTVAALSAGGAVSLYTFTTYMQKFLVNTAGMPVRTASTTMMIAMIAFMVVQPLIGALSDRIGRRKCLLIFSGTMTLAAVPLLTGLSTASRMEDALPLVIAALAILSFYTSISGLFKAELFPPHIRALGVGIAHSVSAAIFGGSAEWLALLAKQHGHETLFYWYVATVCAIAFATALMMREPRRADMMA